MSVLVVGLSHRTAPMDLLERVALDGERARALGARLHAGEHVEEVLVLATCNRLEVVVEANGFHGALVEVGDALCELSGLGTEALTEHLYVHYDERAVSHLFGLACGLDSMAVGESQILGQLREALGVAQRDGRLGAGLNPLVQQALRVGKRAHSETGIDEVSRSLVTLGLERAATVLPSLAEARTVVVGAGAMSGLAVATLVRAGVSDVTVVNRTAERAARLAAQHGVERADWPELADLVGAADLVLACTGSVGHVIDYPALAAARSEQGRVGQPLVLVDLALPRDVDPEVTRLTGVHLWGLGELQEELTGPRTELRPVPEMPTGPGLEYVAATERVAPAVEEGPAGREAAAAVEAGREGRAVEAVREIVALEVASYQAERRAARLGPTLAALRASAARIVDAEMTRLDARLPLLPDDERAEVRQTVQRVVDKLLHTPTVRAKQLQTSATDPSDYAHALRELFDLDPREVAVVSSPPRDPRSSAAVASATAAQEHSGRPPGSGKAEQR